MSRVFLGHAANEADEPEDRLAEGSPGFSLWKRSELPSEWRRSCSAGQVCVAIELPDTPWGRAYYASLWRERGFALVAMLAGGV